MDFGAGPPTGDGATAGGTGDFAVECHGPFERDEGPAIGCQLEEAEIQFGRGLALESGRHLHTVRSQMFQRRAADARIRIAHSHDHAGDAGAQDGRGAGRRSAHVVARLERDQQRGTPGTRTGGTQRHDFGMVTAGRPRGALTDDLIVIQHDGPDGGIWTGAAED